MNEWEETLEINRRIFEIIDSLDAPEEVQLVIKYCIDTGGKRTRPLMVLLSNRLAGGNKKESLDAAVAVEFIHNSSLLHDDILDKGLYRRGKDTPFRRFGYKPALLSGDLLVVMAEDIMLQSYGAGLTKRLNKVILDIINGEVMDVTCSDETTIEEYELCIEKKTAKLFSLATYLGGKIAGSPKTENLENFGEKCGKAYQLVDDLLEFLQIQREKVSLESSLTLPEIYLRKEGVRKEEAVRLSIKKIRELTNEAWEELDVFEESVAKEKIKKLSEKMTKGVLKETQRKINGKPIAKIYEES